MKSSKTKTMKINFVLIVIGILVLIAAIASLVYFTLTNQEFNLLYRTNSAFDELRLVDSETAKKLQLSEPISTDARLNHYKNSKQGTANLAWIVESTYPVINVNINDLESIESLILRDGWKYHYHTASIKESLEREATSIHTPPYRPHTLLRRYTKIIEGKFDSINQRMYFKWKQPLSPPLNEKMEVTPVIETEYVKYIKHSIFLKN